MESKEKLTIRELATLSGVPLKTTEYRYLKKGWKDKRIVYQDELRDKTREKTLEKISEKVSWETSAAVSEHLENYRTFRHLVMRKVRYLDVLCSQDQPMEHMEAQLEKLSSVTLNFLSLILDRAVKGERVALGLDFENYNKAIQVLTTAGFEVLVPEGMEELNQAVNQMTEREGAIDVA